MKAGDVPYEAPPTTSKAGAPRREAPMDLTRFKRASARGLFVGFVMSAVINADGLLRLAGASLVVGGANPILGPISAVLGLALLFLWSRGQPLRERDTRTSSLVAVLLVVTLLPFGTLLQSSSPTKLFRDLTYISTFYIFFLNARWWFTSGRVHLGVLIRTILVLTLFVGPAVSILAWGFDPSGRFGGLVISYPLFAVVSLLLAAISIMVDRSSPWRILVSVVALGAILVSGTRSVLALYCVVVPILIWRTSRRRGYLAFGAASAGVVLAGIVGLLLVRWLAVSADLAFEDLRIFSVDDVDGGSLASRWSWLTIAWDQIAASGFIGGFGAGSSETLLQLLPHFDFIRYWFDYSLLACALLGTLLITTVTPRFAATRDPSRLAVLLMLLVITTHNVFQAAGPILLTAVAAGTVSCLPLYTLTDEGEAH